MHEVQEQLDTPIRNADDTVVHSACLNLSTRVSNAGSMYHIAAKTNMKMDIPATPQTNPISISRIHRPKRLRNRRDILFTRRGLQ